MVAELATDQQDATRPKQSRRLSVANCIAIALIVGIGGFVLGTRSDELMQRVGFTSSPRSLDFSSLQQLYAELNSRFDGTLDTQKLIDGARHGMVAAAGDPYTVYFNKAEATAFQGDLEGTFQGIGAELGKRDDKLSVISTLDNSPAKAAGLLAGDMVVKVNDEDATGWSVDQAVTKIRGEKGTTVKITVLRGTEAKDISITRDEITDPSVKSEVTADNIGIMRISRFGQSETANLAKLAAEDFKVKGVKGVVVDLRGNGGGYRDAAVDLAGLWLKDKTVMTERTNGKITDTLRTGPAAAKADNGSSDTNYSYTSRLSPILEGIPTIVLIDGGSASASEILAGALKDNNAATLLGEKSFGKGSVQTIVELEGGAELKVTVAKWYTPSGKNINKEGIQPDIAVIANEADITAGRDVQKDTAVEKLKAGL